MQLFPSKIRTQVTLKTPFLSDQKERKPSERIIRYINYDTIIHFSWDVQISRLNTSLRISTGVVFS